MSPSPERYATLARLQERITDRSAAAEAMRDILNAASASVEDHCGRVFTKDTTASARVFRPESLYLVTVDDIADATGMTVKVGTDGTFPDTVTDAVWLGPDNASSRARPWETLHSDAWFPLARRPSVEVTALWGWPEVPAVVTEATLILGARLWMRRQSPTGIAGAGEFGVVRVSSTDPDVAALLAPLRRSVF